MTQKIKRFLEILFPGAIVFIFSLLRLPSVIEPYWYGDEGIYELIGIALREGRILYSEIWDNKPPLLYLIYALFSGDQFYVRLASLIAGILTVVIFFIISSKIFKKGFSIVVSTVLFTILFGSPILEGNIANAENFMTLPILGAFYLVFVSRKKKNSNYIIGGILLSLAFLTKIVAIFDFVAFATALFGIRFFDHLSMSKKDVKTEVKNIAISIRQETLLLIGLVIPVVLTTIYFFSKSALSDFFRATFSQNVGYVGYGNFFILPMGLLYLKFFLLLVGIFLVYRLRKTLGVYGFVICIWFSFSMFNAFFSARPYTHYLLVLLPSFCLFLGYVFENTKLIKFTIPLFIIVLILINQNFKFYTKIIAYYDNYISFISGNTTATSYMDFFDRKTRSYYDLAKFINFKTMPNEGIFVWGDSPQIYVLSGKLPPGRYTVSYHITFYRDAIFETQEALEKKRPRFIIQIKESPEIVNFLGNYELRYKLNDTKIYERQF